MTSRKTGFYCHCGQCFHLETDITGRVWLSWSCPKCHTQQFMEFESVAVQSDPPVLVGVNMENSL